MRGIFSSPKARFLAAVTLVAVGSPTGWGAEKATLTVYTYESFVADWGPGPQVKAGFEKICDCQVSFVGLADGVAILNRLKIEGAGSKADVTLGLTAELEPEAKTTGLFSKNEVDTSKLKVPAGFTSDTFVPYDYSYLAIIYDTQTIKDPPTSLDELVNGNAEEKLVIEDPRISTPGLGFLLWMKAVYGDQAAAKWSKLSNRILTVTPGWSEAYGLFTKGETPMVLSYTTSPAYHMIEEKTDRYQAAAFSEGQYLQIELMGVMRNSKQPALAKQFIEFMLSPEIQGIIPTTNWCLPVGSTATPLPPEFGKLVQPTKSLLIDAEAVAANRKAWTDEWSNAVGR